MPVASRPELVNMTRTSERDARPSSILPRGGGAGAKELNEDDPVPTAASSQLGAWQTN